MKQKTLFILSGLVLLLAFVAGTLYYTSQKQTESAQAVAGKQDNLNRAYSPTEGPESAKVVIVDFFDPACGTCRDFYPFVKQLMAAHPGQVRVVLRHAPFHDGSVEVVKIMEAARMQGKYFETLAALFASQDNWVQDHRVQPERVWAALAGIGLDLDRVRQDMNSPEITAHIAQDMEDAKALKVTMTPEFFVNGRPMPSFGYEQLQALVEQAVAENYR
ncbi:MAG: thioredoxin domain-containing protein [Gallionellaceae bacterium]|nr:thioredoxin domain-containing protein [Gallionellaceae bacterium]